MKPRKSKSEFNKFAKANGVNLLKVSAKEGVEQMLAFFRDVKFEGLDEEDGDMMLFQWGTCGREDRLFEVNITRQFCEKDKEGDDALSQLYIGYFFDPTPDTDALGSGSSMWCDQFYKLEDFSEFVMASKALALVAKKTPKKVCLVFEYV